MIERLYIIGPVSGIEDENKQAFLEAAERLESHGYRCAIPHDFIATGTDWKTAMRISISTMLGMNARTKQPTFNGIALLDGWEDSKGATIERNIAKSLQIRCHTVSQWIDRTALAGR